MATVSLECVDKLVKEISELTSKQYEAILKASSIVKKAQGIMRNGRADQGSVDLIAGYLREAMELLKSSV